MDPDPVEGDGYGSSHHEGTGGSSPPLSGLTASQRRADIRRRKLLMNSEERINRIMGFHRPKAGKDGAWPGIGGPRARKAQAAAGGRRALGGRAPFLRLLKTLTPGSSPPPPPEVKNMGGFFAAKLCFQQHCKRLT